MNDNYESPDSAFPTLRDPDGSVGRGVGFFEALPHPRSVSTFALLPAAFFLTVCFAIGVSFFRYRSASPLDFSEIIVETPE